MAVSPAVSLDKWLGYRADILLYERSWKNEVTAGNYMVRQSPLGKRFLELWADFDHRASTIKEFSSYDNGAIHLVLLQLLSNVFAGEDYQGCQRLYQNLKRGTDDLTEYYEFVACTRYILGPNRKWKITGYADGTLVFLHRYHGFVEDQEIGLLKSGGAIPFMHGIKNPNTSMQEYEAAEPWSSPLEHSLYLKQYDDRIVCAKNCTIPAKIVPKPSKIVPRIRLGSCLANFSCRLATMTWGPSVNAYRNIEDGNGFVFDHELLYGP